MQLYVVRSKIDKSSEEEKTRYYGVPVLSGTVTEDDLAKEISERSSLSPADVLAAISSIGDLMQKHLSEGKSVNLKGIGIFSVSATSEGCDTPEECTPAKVKAQRICFRADNVLRSILEGMKYKLTKRGKAR